MEGRGERERARERRGGERDGERKERRERKERKENVNKDE